MASRRSSKATDSVALLLPAAAGLLSFLSFPRPGFGALAWVALAPLVASVIRARSVKGAFACGFVYGLVLYFPLLVWIPPVLVRYGDIPAWLAWLLYALLTAAFA